MIVNHPGLIEDSKRMDRMQRFGVKTDQSEHVEVAFQQTDRRTEQTNARLESIYDSRRREPLGKPYSRGHMLPPETQRTDFSFGVKASASESAKNLIYPAPATNEDQFSDQYTRSHGSYGPGEQRNRNYAWEQTGIDPNKDRFGRQGPHLAHEGVGAILNPAKDDAVPKNRMVSQAVEQMRSTRDELGRCRNLGLNQQQTRDRVFGVQGAVDQWGAPELITGNYSVPEQMPDADLGRAVKSGWCNVTTDNRAFGCPTVRTDIRKPAARSVADAQNYGDDVSAGTLVQPAQHSHLGVEDDDFFAPLDRGEIREMFEAIGYTLPDQDFEQIWHAAGGGARECSINAFQNSLNRHLDNQQR
jgi:hypothetical protein